MMVLRTMKHVTALILLSLLVSTIGAVSGNQPMQLQSQLLKTVDGRFINADIIEVMRKFQRKLLAIMLGDQDGSVNRVGRYKFNGKPCGAHELSRHEEQLKKATGVDAGDHDPRAQELQGLLRDAKRDFITIAGEFRAVARGSKPIIAALVEESCTRRGRAGSLLCQWSRMKEADEDALFDQNIKTFGDYSHFCVDLMNFLGDLIHSCPKANMLFMARVDKWAKVSQLMPVVMGADLQTKKTEFSTYIKKNHLDNMALKDITLERLRAMFTSFKGQKPAVA